MITIVGINNKAWVEVKRTAIVCDFNLSTKSSSRQLE